MKKDNKHSYEHELFLKKQKRETVVVIFCQIAVLIAIILLWELMVKIGVFDAFITSSPSKIAVTVYDLFANNDLLYHIGITLYETVIGFAISVIFGYGIALILWWSTRLKRILEPYIVVLNSLPKIALGPIIIVWFGSGERAIIAMAVLISIIVCLMTMLGAFYETDKDKILLLKSMGANKFTIMKKLVIPSSKEAFINMLKIALGMAWIGSIMGEYLVSKAGLGYLIVYGSQVFKLDLVMASTVVLLILSGIMYYLVTLLEKALIKHDK